jgi:anti-sigma-K factor RsiG
MIGGKRRIDQVLAPEFAESIEDVDLEELRRRRDMCRAEREYLSYLRRLVQGRRDILQAELDRRRRGADEESLLADIAAILADAPTGPSRGEAPVITIPEEEITLARRKVERLVSDSHLSDLPALSDEDLEEAITRIDEEERSLSDLRAKVMAVHDELQSELVRRWKERLGGLSV